MNAKQPRSNLSREQKQAMKEIKEDPEINIYPFDKGNEFVRLKTEDSVQKMIEGIGNTKIIEKDQTKAHLKKIQEVLRAIKKRN